MNNFLIDLIVSLIAGIIGGGLSSVVIYNQHKKVINKMINKNANFSNDGDVIMGKKNGD